MKASQLKAIARQRIAGKAGTLIGAALVYYIILFAIFLAILFVYSANLISQGVFASLDTMEAYLDNALNTSTPALFLIDIVSIALGAVIQTLSVGFLYICLNTARLRQIKISDLFYVYKRNPDKVILISLIQSGINYLCLLIPTLISRFTGISENVLIILLYYVFSMLGYAAETIAVILLSQSYFIYIDNPNESVITCIKVSAKIMRNNIGRYFVLGLTFIGWFLLVAVSCGVAILFVMPYLYVTFALFYMQLKGELGSSVDITIS